MLFHLQDLGSKSKSETDNFLQFFDEATLEELTAMPGCSKKKALVIMELRPFKTWENLVCLIMFEHVACAC